MQVLKKRPTIGVHGCVVQKGLSDVAFSSNDKSRLVKSGNIIIFAVEIDSSSLKVDVISKTMSYRRPSAVR